MSRLSRRQCLAYLASLAIADRSVLAHAGIASPRIATLTWPGAQTLLTIGIQPLATVDRVEYSRLRLKPELAAAVLELGHYAEPNLELLSELRPDLILIDADQTALKERLEKIAPAQVASINTAQGRPYWRACALTRVLASRFGREKIAQSYLDALNRRILETRAALSPVDRTPTFIVDLSADGRHVSVYAENSMLNDVMQQLGIPNAWTGPSNFWGFTTAGIEDLAYSRGQRLLYLDRGVLTRQALDSLGQNPLWRSLPFVKSESIAPLRAIYPFGGLPTAEQFLADITTLLIDKARPHA